MMEKKSSGINLIGSRDGWMEHGWHFDSRVHYMQIVMNIIN
jgi:hypothetical protein